MPVAMVAGAVHPHFGASMIARTTVVIPMIDRTAPTRSRGGVSRSLDSGTSATTPMSATATIGMFTKNTEPHQKCSRSQPPRMGPAATDSPATPDHAPIAAARSFGSTKTLVRIASVAGKISAAPMPISARAAMSASALSTSPARTEVAAKASSPTTSARRRP